jgi:hypothetical protein
MAREQDIVDALKEGGKTRGVRVSDGSLHPASTSSYPQMHLTPAVGNRARGYRPV